MVCSAREKDILQGKHWPPPDYAKSLAPYTNPWDLLTAYLVFVSLIKKKKKKERRINLRYSSSSSPILSDHCSIRIINFILTLPVSPSTWHHYDIRLAAALLSIIYF